MRIFPYRIDNKGRVKKKTKETKNRKPKGLNTKPMKMWAVDTIERVSQGIRRYIMTMIDPSTRVAFAVAIPSKNTRYTSKVLGALIDGLLYDSNQSNANQYAIL